MLRKCWDGRPNGWHRTAPPLLWPCWIAAARSDATQCRDNPTSTLAILPWLPARDSRRTPAVRPRSPGQWRRHRRSLTPPPASPRPARGALARRRARCPAQPRRARLVNAALSARVFSESCRPSAVDLPRSFELYLIGERLLEAFALAC